MLLFFFLRPSNNANDLFNVSSYCCLNSDGIHILEVRLKVDFNRLITPLVAKSEVSSGLISASSSLRLSYLVMAFNLISEAFTGIAYLL